MERLIMGLPIADDRVVGHLWPWVVATAVMLVNAPPLATAVSGSQDYSVDQELAERVNDFAERWLRMGDPGSAVDGHLSEGIDRANLLPRARRGDRAPDGPPFREREDGPVSRLAARQRMVAWLAAMSGGSGGRSVAGERRPDLVPLSAERDMALLEWLDQREMEGRVLSGARPLRFFRVTTWDDIAWTHSGVPGHRAISAGFLEERRIETMLAVVGQLQEPSRPERTLPLVMLWAAGDGGGWGLWAVIAVPTE